MTICVRTFNAAISSDTIRIVIFKPQYQFILPSVTLLNLDSVLFKYTWRRYAPGIFVVVFTVVCVNGSYWKFLCGSL